MNPVKLITIQYTEMNDVDAVPELTQEQLERITAVAKELIRQSKED